LYYNDNACKKQAVIKTGDKQCTVHCRKYKLEGILSGIEWKAALMVGLAINVMLSMSGTLLINIHYQVT